METVTAPELAQLAETKRTDLTMVDPRRINVIAGLNTRDIDPYNIAMLKPSIAAQGVIVPLTVVRVGGKNLQKDGLDSYELISGHHRLQAVMELIAEGVLPEGTRVPVRLSNARTEADKIIENYSENIQKSNDFASLANAVSRLVKFGFTEQEVAEKLHVPQAKVKRALEISASSELMEEIKQGAISESLAYQILSSTGFDVEKTNELVTTAKEVAKEEGKDKVTGSSVEKARKETGIEKTRTRITEKMQRKDASYKVDRLIEIMSNEHTDGEEVNLTLGLVYELVNGNETAEEYATRVLGWTAPDTTADTETADNTENPSDSELAAAEAEAEAIANTNLELSDEEVDALEELGFNN